MYNNISSLKTKISLAVHKLLKCYDIGFIFNNLNSLLLLDVPFKKSNQLEEDYQRNKCIALESIDKAETTYQELLKELELRTNIFNRIREINPNFCSNIKSRISEEEYKEYITLIRGFSHNISSLLLHVPLDSKKDYLDKSSLLNDYSALVLNKEDEVSSIIDSRDSSRVSYIEDMFVLKELNDVDTSSMDSKTAQDIDLLRNILLERIEKYRLFDELYNKGRKNDLEER